MILFTFFVNFVLFVVRQIQLVLKKDELLLIDELVECNARMHQEIESLRLRLKDELLLVDELIECTARMHQEIENLRLRLKIEEIGAVRAEETMELRRNVLIKALLISKLDPKVRKGLVREAAIPDLFWQEACRQHERELRKARAMVKAMGIEPIAMRGKAKAAARHGNDTGQELPCHK